MAEFSCLDELSLKVQHDNKHHNHIVTHYTLVVCCNLAYFTNYTLNLYFL